MPVHGSTVTPAEMTEAQQIMFNRVNSAGFTEAQVVPQGTNIMTVSVPGQNSQKVVQLVSQTAELLFRQVQLIAPNAATAVRPTPHRFADSLGHRVRHAVAERIAASHLVIQGQGQGVAGRLHERARGTRQGRYRPDRGADQQRQPARRGTAAQAKASPTPTPSATSTPSA